MTRVRGVGRAARDAGGGGPRLTVTVASLVACALASCGRIGPCGWDEALVLDASYDVNIVEEYTPETTTAFYSDEFGLTRPAETCGALDEIGVGDEVTIRLVQGASANLRCSMWFAEITSPVLDLGPRNPLIINNTSYNQIVASGSRDLGGGCEGNWELSIHAPDNDPFIEQVPGAVPVVLAYRVFSAAPEANAACSALAGREPSEGAFSCGDAFVVSMERRP